MEVPLQIAFDGLDPSPALRTLVETEAVALERFHDHITSCPVVVSAPAKPHHRKGAAFDIAILVRMPPQKELAVRRHVEDEPQRQHAAVAVREAFDVARRQVEDAIRILRGDVKARSSG